MLKGRVRNGKKKFFRKKHKYNARPGILPGLRICVSRPAQSELQERTPVIEFIFTVGVLCTLPASLRDRAGLVLHRKPNLL